MKGAKRPGSEDPKIYYEKPIITGIQYTYPYKICHADHGDAGFYVPVPEMVDGVFVANLVGENALSALNIVYPVPSAIIAVSIMLATGGSAVIARNMGEKREREAKEIISPS